MAIQAAQSLTILPVMGLKTSVPADDPSLLVPVSEGVFASYAVDGQNFDLQRSRNSCTKIRGYETAANADAAPGNAQALYNFKKLSGTSLGIAFDSGAGYWFSYDTMSQDQTKFTGAVTFNTTGYPFYSLINFADYLVIADFGGTTPYKWDGASSFTKLILSGTEYKFRYLEEFQTRIIGAYTDQTNGDIEFRYTDALPALASLSFPVVNQLYKPNSNPITGLRRINSNACIIYDEFSAHRIEYYPQATIPFNITTVLEDIGTCSNASIVSAFGKHYFFDYRYGFVEFNGVSAKVISGDIEDLLRTVYYQKRALICGTFIAPDRIVWSVPIASASQNKMLVYNITTGQWETITRSFRVIASMPVGAAASTLVVRPDQLVMENANGIVYAESDSVNVDGTSDIDGYRIEPIMDFGNRYAQKRLAEIWFGIVQGGDYSLDVSWRGGNTVKEVLASSWTALDSLSLNSPENPVIYADKSGRFHQIKWGTNLKNELFEVNRITLKYDIVSR